MKLILRKLRYLIVPIIIFSFILKFPLGASTYDVKEVKAFVYRDGYVHITVKLEVNETIPFVQIEILTQKPEFLIVLGDSELIDYELNGRNLTIYTLGATDISVEYDAGDLTRKEGDVWTLIINAPYHILITLPENSSLIYFNNLPDEIKSIDGRTTLKIRPGYWEISYILAPFKPTPPITRPGPAVPIIPTEALLSSAIAIVIIAAIIIVLRRRRALALMELDPREREVINLIASRGGRIMEAEVKEALKLPKSTAWRILRRLERKGFVKIRKIGGQNQVELLKFKL